MAGVPKSSKRGSFVQRSSFNTHRLLCRLIVRLREMPHQSGQPSNHWLQQAQSAIHLSLLQARLHQWLGSAHLNRSRATRCPQALSRLCSYVCRQWKCCKTRVLQVKELEVRRSYKPQCRAKIRPECLTMPAALAHYRQCH